MNKKDLHHRFKTLESILYFSRGRGYFNAGKRTCIHMERAAILRAKEELDLTDAVTATPSYTIPEHLEKKCKQVISDFKI